MPPQMDDLLTSRQAAPILGKSVSSVHYYVTRGRLPVAFQTPHEAGRGAMLFLRSDVEALAAELAQGEAA